MVAYMTVRIPEDLVKQVDEVIKGNNGGYRSRAEFVKEAIRFRLEELVRYQMRAEK